MYVAYFDGPEGEGAAVSANRAMLEKEIRMLKQEGFSFSSIFRFGGSVALLGGENIQGWGGG